MGDEGPCGCKCGGGLSGNKERWVRDKNLGLKKRDPTHYIAGQFKERKWAQYQEQDNMHHFEKLGHNRDDIQLMLEFCKWMLEHGSLGPRPAVPDPKPAVMSRVARIAKDIGKVLKTRKVAGTRFNVVDSVKK